LSIGSAFRAFFSLLGGKFPEDIAREYGFVKASTIPVTPPAPPLPQVKASDGALQLLGILQRDSRLVDFLMEDISGYSDEQVGGAMRGVHEQCRTSLERYLKLTPVIDGVEGTYTKLDSGVEKRTKLIGNVPASGKAPGGLLRHKGWRAEKIDLPKTGTGEDLTIVAPAEIEIE
jgi:hypothetical protein